MRMRVRVRVGMRVWIGGDYNTYKRCYAILTNVPSSRFTVAGLESIPNSRANAESAIMSLLR